MSTSTEPREERRAYRQIVRFAQETPWAILPSLLWTIRELLEAHVAGVRLSAEQIDEAVGPRRGRGSPGIAGAVAVVPLRGILVPHAGMMVDTSQPGTGVDEWLNTFRAAVADPDVETVLLDVDSPGGSGDLITETAAEVRQARSRKRIVAVANTMAASAAYAIASQAETFLVTPSGMVGSIGVYSIHEDVSQALEAKGVKPTVIQAPDSGFKTETSPFGPLSDEARAHLQETVDNFYRMFVQDVAAGRGVTASTVEAKFGRGRLLTAQAAANVGMVDGVATFDQTLARLLAGKPIVRGPRQAELEPAPLEVLAAGGLVDGAAVAELGPGELVIPGDYLDRIPGLREGAIDVDFVQKVADAFDVPAQVVSGTATFGDPGGNEAGSSVSVSIHTNTSRQSAAEAVEEAAAAEGITERSSSSQAAAAPVAVGNEEGGTAMETVSFADGRPPTLEELAAEQDMYRARQLEMNTQAAGRAFTAEEQGEFDDLVGKIDQLEVTKQNIRARNETIRRQAANPDRLEDPTAGLEGGTTGPRQGTDFQVKRPARIPENLFDLASYRSHVRGVEELPERWHDGAKRANELLPYETDNPDKTRSFVERMLAKDPSFDPAESFGHRLLLTGNPAYERAFGKLVMGKPLSANEETLINMAVSNTGLGAETPVPVTIDPSVLLTSDGVVNPMRRLARVVTITGNKWQGIASEGVTVAYEAELTQVADQTPSFDAPSAEVAKAHGWVEFSIEVDQDWGSFRSELSAMFQDARDAKEADKFLNGSGTNEPQGLLDALVDDGASIVKTDGVGTLALSDIQLVTDELPARFDANASWLANKAFYGEVRGLAAKENSVDVWLQLASSPGQPPNLIGYPAYAHSEISKLFTVGDEEVAILGDFGRGFIIVDRIGMNVEIVAQVMGPNNRPKGSRGMYCYYRNTSQLLAANAFRVLQIAAT